MKVRKQYIETDRALHLKNPPVREGSLFYFIVKKLPNSFMLLLKAKLLLTK